MEWKLREIKRSKNSNHLSCDFIDVYKRHPKIDKIKIDDLLNLKAEESCYQSLR